MDATPWWRDKAPEATWPVFEDFRVFLRLTWSHLGLPSPTPVQLDIAQWLQHGPRRAIIEAFRGVGKSWITSAFVCWLLLRDPQLNILVVSASKERADQFSTFTLRLIGEMDILKHLYPREDQRASKIAFDVAPATADHAPSVKSVGVLGQMAGSRGDYIIADDVEVPNNSETQQMRDKLQERVKEFDAILKPSGRVLYLGTPQTEESLYNVLADRGYTIRVWPAQIPSRESLKNYGERLAPMIANMVFTTAWNAHGTPTDPKRFTDMDLMEREASYGRSGYALQFMLDTQLSDADRYPLKLSDLVVMRVDREMGPEKVIYGGDPIQTLPAVGFTGDFYRRPIDCARHIDHGIIMHPFVGTVMAIDPSGRGKDETTWMVVRALNSQLFLVDFGATRQGYEDQTLQDIADCAKRNAVNHVVIEANFGDGMFQRLLEPFLRRTYPVTCEEIRSSSQKEKRIIDVLEPVMNQHRLVIDEALVQRDYDSTKDLPPEQANQYRLFYQMTRMTKERGALRHDDRIDCLAIAVAYWVEQMAADIQEEIDVHQKEALMNALESFVNDPGGDRKAYYDELDGHRWF